MTTRSTTPNHSGSIDRPRRIGELLGPPQQGRRSDLTCPGSEQVDLSRQEASKLRTLAAHPEIVDRVAAESTDARPASINRALTGMSLRLQLPSVPMRVTPLTGRDPLDEVLAAIGHGRPAWQRDALCREYDPAAWFPTKFSPTMTSTARAVCARCAVLEDCQRWAIADPSLRDGIFGGLDPAQRAAARRAAAA